MNLLELASNERVVFSIKTLAPLSYDKDIPESVYHIMRNLMLFSRKGLLQTSSLPKFYKGMS